MPDVVDFTRMKPGKLLFRFRDFEQRIELCPLCHQPGKPRFVPGGRQYVHRTRVIDGTYTRNAVACVVPDVQQ